MELNLKLIIKQNFAIATDHSTKNILPRGVVRGLEDHFSAHPKDEKGDYTHIYKRN
jgi:hypothetical protein